MKPIFFNTEMVRAILAGRKTVTRRVVKPQPVHEGGFWKLGGAWWSDNIKTLHPVPCHSLWNRQPYKPGDVLWVRETWQQNYDGSYVYRAGDKFENKKGWRPSIHMPREAARIFLRVTDVRVERLQDIDDGQAKAEGFVGDIDLVAGPGASAARHFADLWDSTIKPADRDKYGWDANPWVWVIEFKRIDRQEAEHEKA